MSANDGATVIIASHDVTLTEHTNRSLRLLDGRLIPSTAPKLATSTEETV